MVELDEESAEDRSDSLGFARERVRPCGIVFGKNDLHRRGERYVSN
jgi:hypothetical protein